MRDIERRANAFGNALGSILKAGAGAAAAGMGLYIRNTIGAEKVQAQLLARIKDTGGAAGRAIEQLNAQADKLQALTVFDDEAIGEAQSVLLLYKNISGVTFDRTIDSALDLATVMGTEASAAAKILGKALSDPERGLTALTRAGITFTEAERERIKVMAEAGRIAEAQNAILDKLQGTMGSAAEAARGTLGGALQALKNAFNNVLEGEAGDDGMKATVQAVNDLTDAMNSPDVRRGADNIAGGIATIVAQSIQGVGALQRLTDNLNAIFSIGKKVSSGAPASAFTDRELQIRLANLSGQKSKARKAGDTGEVARLQGEITALIRENTRRLTDGAVSAVAQDFARNRGLAENFGLFVTPPGYKSPTKSGTGKRSGGSTRSQRDLPDFAKDAAEEARKAAEAVADAQEQFEAWAASLAGPVAEAAYKFATDQERLNELARKGEINATDLATAQANLRAEYDKSARAIEDQLNPSREVIKNLEQELALIGLSNVDREKMIALRYANVDAMSAEGQRITEIVEAIDARTQQSEAASRWADGITDTLFALRGGLKEAEKTFTSFIDSMIRDALRAMANKWLQQLLSGSWGFKAPAAGSAAEQSAFDAWFGGGREHGGPVGKGTAYLVGERGPELFVPRTSGAIVAAPQTRQLMSNDSRVVNQTFVVKGMMGRRTAQQVARQTGIEARRAMARNG